MPKPVALLLLNWNTPAHTITCIHSIRNYCDPALFDIIIADNGSVDGSIEHLNREFPDLVILDNRENLGYAEGNNRAIQYSIAKGYHYSLVMNNDTAVEEDLVKAMFFHLEAHTEAAAVQPAIYWMHNRQRLWNGDGRYNRITGKVWSNTRPAHTLPPYIRAKWLTGCCMLIRNKVLEQQGVFNKHYFLYYEDVELSFRLRAAGHELHYISGLSIYHEAGASSQVPSTEKEGTLSPVIHYYVCRNHIWLLRTYGSKFLLPLMFCCRSPYYLVLLSYFILKGKRKKASYLWKGIKDGIFTPKNTFNP